MRDDDDGVADAERALAIAVEEQSDDALEAWAATGRLGLELLRALVTGSYLGSWRPMHPKDEMDGVASAASAIAARHPDAFLEVFSGPRFMTDVTVLIGLGSIDDPEATRRLLIAAGASDQWVRMRAVIGLARRTGADAEAALVRAIDDDEYLVRHHALVGLAANGTVRALRRLRDFQAPSHYERRLANDAIFQIEGRIRT